MKIKPQYTSYKNGKIAYTSHGRGRVVVLLHGFLGSSAIWQYTRDELAKRFRVICIDLPGHGKSDCYGYVHSMELMAGAVKAVMEKLRLKRYVLIGHSMGGYTALAFGELFPDHVRGLGLIHSTSYADSVQKKKDRNAAIRAVKRNPGIYVRAAIKNLFAAKHLKHHKSEISFAMQIAVRTPKQGIVNALEGMKDRPSRDVVLHFAKYPVLFVIGKFDNILPMQTLLDQSRLLKCRHLLLEDSGHMGFLEQPDVSVKELKRFIRRCFSPGV